MLYPQGSAILRTFEPLGVYFKLALTILFQRSSCGLKQQLKLNWAAEANSMTHGKEIEQLVKTVG